MTVQYVPPSPNSAAWAAVVAPSDTANQGTPFRALWIGGAGDVVIVMGDGSVVTFKSVSAGYMLPVGGIRVNATNTTATNIVAVY